MARKPRPYGVARCTECGAVAEIRKHGTTFQRFTSSSYAMPHYKGIERQYRWCQACCDRLLAEDLRSYDAHLASRTEDYAAMLRSAGKSEAEVAAKMEEMRGHDATAREARIAQFWTVQG